MAGQQRPASDRAARRAEPIGRRPARRSAQKLAAERAAQRRQIKLLGIIGVALVAALVLILVNLPNGGTDLPVVVAAADPHPGLPTSGRSLGDPNAPVTVVEYGDYQCPACSQFATDLEPRLVADYVATGLVRFEFRDYAFLDERVNGNESHDAAAAAFCAADQGQFWRYHATLYGNQHGENRGAFSRDRLRSMAEAIGLDTDAFNRCLDDGTYEDAVDAANAEAEALGLGGTPSFTINGQVIDYRGYERLAAEIDAALVAAGVSR